MRVDLAHSFSPSSIVCTAGVHRIAAPHTTNMKSWLVKCFCPEYTKIEQQTMKRFSSFLFVFLFSHCVCVSLVFALKMYLCLSVEIVLRLFYWMFFFFFFFIFAGTPCYPRWCNCRTRSRIQTIRPVVGVMAHRRSKFRLQIEGSRTHQQPIANE